MTNKISLGLFILLFCGNGNVMSQKQNVNKVSFEKEISSVEKPRVITIPDVDGYKVLKCDFHIHTVFSDGDVWPTVRVQEAIQDGLDAIAMTDHIEYRPKDKYFKYDLNTSYDIAKTAVKNSGFILVKGIEITKDKKVGGHLNALFITDALPLNDPTTSTQVDNAISQGAYIIWNHPGWAVDSCMMYEPNLKWIKEGKIHAVEVFNDVEYYPRATTWAKDYKLAPVACSDIHGAISDRYPNRDLRPKTLVFAKEKSEESLKEALMDRRTLAWFGRNLAGDAILLDHLFNSCVSITKDGNSYIMVNNSDIPFDIEIDNNIKIKIEGKVSVKFNYNKKLNGATVKLINCYTSENECLSVVLNNIK